MGGYGALSYAYQGFVDIRLTMLLYLGSLLGIYLGVYGVKVVNEKYIRLVTSVIIILCVISRVIAIPMYMRQLGWLSIDPGLDRYFHVIRTFRQRRGLYKTLQVVRETTPIQTEAAIS